jgi:hypothetical protein
VYAFAQTRLSRKTSIVPRFWHAGTSLSYGLQEQVRQRKLRVPRATSVGQVMGDEITEAQSFVQPTNQNQAAVGAYPRCREIEFQGRLRALEACR